MWYDLTIFAMYEVERHYENTTLQMLYENPYKIFQKEQPLYL